MNDKENALDFDHLWQISIAWDKDDIFSQIEI